MGKKSLKTEEKPLKIHTAVEIPDGPIVVSDSFNEFIENENELREQLRLKRERKDKIRYHIKLIAWGLLLNSLLTVFLLGIYSYQLRERWIGSIQKEVISISQQADSLKQEVQILEETKASLEKDPKIIQELQRREKQQIADRLISDKFTIVLSKLSHVSEEYSDSEVNRSKISDGISLASSILRDLDSYEKSFGAAARSQLVARTAFDISNKALIKNFNIACVRGSLTSTNVYFRTGLITDYIVLLSAEDYHPADVLNHFREGFAKYLEVQQSNDFYKITEAIGIAENSLNQIQH